MRTPVRARIISRSGARNEQYTVDVHGEAPNDYTRRYNVTSYSDDEARKMAIELFFIDIERLAERKAYSNTRLKGSL